MKGSFDPIRGERGEFRVALNLTALGARAWEVLSLSQQLNFEQPHFVSHKDEVWAIVLQQFHRYDADPLTVVDPWDEQMHDLWQAVGEDPLSKLMIIHNFEAYHVGIA
jgi:hypothetical protein